ncbi:MAG: biotin transporter BioY [Gammaproteobacteria bacterium]|nr:biotin transporter BioY [Gammaproteobacteria bacterium]MCW5584253.1 biotin transporter BioY [Gammaproteobacteria bacterium]
MNYLFNIDAPMQSIFLKKENTTIKHILNILSGIIILSIASQLSIPLKPIPLTFQSATVILIGMAYGARNGSYVIIAYLLSGLCGLPVFANFSAGFSTLFDPSAGYLLGFLPAAFVSGYLSQKGWAKNIATSFIAACLGVSIIFSFGIIVLSQFIGWKNAVTSGLVPFVLSEPIKLLAVSCLIPRLWKKPVNEV